MTIGTDCLTPYGASAEDIAKSLDAFGADVIGLNCSVGPQTILDAGESMRKVTRKKISAQPNAGMPREVGGRSRDMASPEYMAAFETEDQSLYYFNLHVQDVGHTLVLGPTGSGKSFPLNFLVTHAPQYEPHTFIFDVGGSYRWLTNLLEGPLLAFPPGGGS